MATELTPFGKLYQVPSRNGLTKPKAVRGAGVKMVNMGEIFAHGRLKMVKMDRVPLSDKERATSLLESGDLLFAQQSLVLSGAGKCSIFLEDDEPVTFESHIIRVRLDNSVADPIFYYYYFQSPRGRSFVKSIVEQGAGASGIRGSDLSNLRVDYLPIDLQQKTISILGVLDDKIDLNRRMNETLEAMARALFKSWFVHFDPVHAKAEGRQPAHMEADTAALFPDAFDDEGLPVGWTLDSLGELAESPRRGVKPNEVPEDTPYIGLEHMPRRSIALTDWEEAGKVTSTKSRFEVHEFLYGKLRPYFHKVGVAPVNGICSTDIVVVRPLEQVWRSFVIACISTEEFVDYTDQTSSGTKMPRTNWKDMARYQITKPDTAVATKFDDIVWPMVEKIVANIHENRTLEELRDTLLPKLMSGEVRVRDQVEEIA